MDWKAIFPKNGLTPIQIDLNRQGGWAFLLTRF